MVKKPRENLKNMTIEVNQEDIDKGERNAAHSCPIAYAIKRKLGDVHVSVYLDCIFVGDPRDNPLVYYKPSSKEVGFIQDFDNGDVVKPFTFNIPLYTCLNLKKTSFFK